MQVRQTLWLSASFTLCTYVMGMILVPSPIWTTHSAPRVLVWGTGSSRCHCHLEPAPSQPWDGDRASTGSPSPATARHCSRSIRPGSGLTCPALRQRQHLCSSSAPEQSGLGTAKAVPTRQGDSWEKPSIGTSTAAPGRIVS